MPSLKVAALALLAATGSALPAARRDNLVVRQAQNGTVPTTEVSETELNDLDILQIALTLEHLEEAYYREGFAKFPDSDFAALGLKPEQIEDLKRIGQTEQEHVSFLQSTLAQAGVQPVQPCQYEFNVTDAKGMATLGALFENVGVSGYLGLAKRIKDPAILSAAATIVTIESRHQSSLRVLLGQTAVPQAFDAPLSLKSVFSIAAPFIKSCPQGSNLAVTPFPALTMEARSGEASAMTVGSTVRVAAASGASAATHCAFTSGGVVPGGTAFTPFSESTGCQIPQGVAGVTYLSLSSSAPLNGALTDDITVAGPMILAL
ncbi:Ferritin/ribonucleotide reductase-like protein [Metarhizium guizhouense ARSEF 977]|uniref:Ferritin/ribonucleotide reductase-like protein n=1 Tax=Metarhizium guizhouense (strain ARSEF 977) TaxID=1276136 RepID=A0A0B4I4C4_METGA|nr:Ferritin/ribonucleotide reductase-like protein [Metarhizium guizhouense ARSEF 977]